MFGQLKLGRKELVFIVLFASSILLGAAAAQSIPARANNSSAVPAKESAVPRNHRNRFPKRADMYYLGVWGIDSLQVKWVESGEMIRLSYRVLDPEKAKMLNDKKQNPLLIDEQARVSLVVPQMEKVGQLRQTSTPEEGRVYWMLFSNKGRYVKRGHRVNVVIGQFHANGLVVD